jgi:Lon protease-like protein
MFEIPLFPLDIVLFPGMPLSLHIFEDRYKLLIGKCLQERQPFGVVLIKKGREALGPLAEPHLVGCTAYVSQVERVEQGRMNIGAIGRDRFRINSMDQSLPYLLGQVERFPIGDVNRAEQKVAADRLRPWVIRYLAILPEVEDLTIEPRLLPVEPIHLAYLAATLLQVPLEQKQSLLLARQSLPLLEELHDLYRREIALVKVMRQKQGVDEGFFSLN